MGAQVSQQTTNRSFDELARALASGSITRRKALRLMGAALVGGALGSLGGVAAADDLCKPTGKKCRKDAQCCSGNCVSSGTSRHGTCASCTPGTPCGPAGGRCFANASGSGATCVCTEATCAASCGICSDSEVCVLAAGACGLTPLACVTPCPGT
jgi:hypothetical protein